MSNELVEQKTGGLVSTINQQGLGEMLKPLIKEIRVHPKNCVNLHNGVE